MNRLLKEMLVLGSAGLAILYLINPTAGFLEFLPDNLPLVGNLDEVAAVALLLNALRYYGIDVTRLFTRDRETITVSEKAKHSEYPRVIGRTEDGEQIIVDRNERGEVVVVQRNS